MRKKEKKRIRIRSRNRAVAMIALVIQVKRVRDAMRDFRDTMPKTGNEEFLMLPYTNSKK